MRLQSPQLLMNGGRMNGLTILSNFRRVSAPSTSTIQGGERINVDPFDIISGRSSVTVPSLCSSCVKTFNVLLELNFF
ncbi:hypothetical protein WA026_000619 [Henosepilachna vigintioctopunctata]|uniref:Uncharacterized protein n=1 Tax=Henosepilachna vigintioctopunctata TaxID=420089 RepID=A0AAW1V5Q8_9CUCU